MEYALSNNYVVFTHDLDFGALLAATQASAPSVIQVRIQDILPDTLSFVVISALRQFETELEIGALVSIDVLRSRVRILPIGNRSTL
jgi:predicted nuclease of predicted toxin-antitoxin system